MVHPRQVYRSTPGPHPVTSGTPIGNDTQMADLEAVVTRLRKQRGMSLRGLAKAVPCDPSYLSKAVRGVKPCGPALARLMDKTLGADGEIIEAAARAARQTPPGQWPGSGQDPAGNEGAQGMISAIAAALHVSPGESHGRDAGQLERDVVRAWELRQSSRYAELGDLLTDLLRDVGTSHAGTASAIHVYNLASAMCKGVGAHEMSAILADRAFLSATRDGSPLLIGAAKMRVANAYLAAGRYAEAIAVAAAAADELPPGRDSAPEEIATFGSLVLCAAVAAARMGEPAQAWEFLGHARAATSLYDREHADLYAVFGPANLAIHGVQVATELGDGREALRRAERTDPGRLPAVLLERRTTLLIDIARAQHMQRDNAGAVATLLEAERVAPLEVLYSSAARVLLGGLLGADRISADLRGLADRLNVAA